MSDTTSDRSKHIKEFMDEFGRNYHEKNKKIYDLDLKIRRQYSLGIFVFVVLYVLVSIAMMMLHKYFQISDALMIAYLSTTVMTTIGLFHVMIKNLFK